MQKHTRLKVAGGAAALVAALGAGGAIAADRLSPSEESDAVVTDAAKQLGVSADKLDAALKQALENRVDAAVEAGRLSEAQGAALKARIASGDVPLVGLGPGFGHHHGGPRGLHLDAAATYLGIAPAALRTRLGNGDTLADVAKAEGKSVDGLVGALVASEKAELDDAVDEGRLTEAQRTSILADLKSRIQDAVNGEAGFGFRHGPEGRGAFGGFGGPPPSTAPDA
jgi:hypothetical protein